VASKDLGQLGLAQSQPVMYEWKLYYQIPNLILWLILLGCLLLKENRNWQAWLVLIPLAAVCVLWGMMRQLLPSVGSQANAFSHIVSTLMLGAAILWLMSDRLAQCKPAATFFLSLAILVAAGLISMYAFSGTSFSNESQSLLVMQLAWAVSLVFGLLIARHFCRKKCGGVGFALSLLLWMIVVFDVMMFAVIVSMLALQGSRMSNVTVLFMAVPLTGTFLAALAYLFTLPYIILT
jgi:hypothetical protein